MEAIFARFPKCLIQFEDFQTRYAKRLLKRYKGIYRVFNDDIQVLPHGNEHLSWFVDDG